jgi:hypothetical protein
MELKDLKSYQALKEMDTLLYTQVSTVYDMVKETINGISGHYNNFTMHDMNHGLRVASYMEQLAFGIDDKQEERLKQFTALELALLILSAILHDIGMFIRPEDEREIKENKIKYSDTLTYDGVFQVKNDEKETIKEIVRLTHSSRISEFIAYDFGDNNSIAKTLKVNNLYAYSDDVVAICRAHGEDYNYLKTELRKQSTKGSYVYNQQYLAVLLRIADYIDLDKQRTPMLWFSMMGIEGFSREEWESHFQIHNEMKLKEYMDGKMQIYFDGESSNAKIHRKYLKYIDGLKTELENADSLLNTLTAKIQYRLNVSTKIDDCVQTKGFQYSDLRLSLDYTAITELLMGKNIYGDSRLGLRELIQNSIDACKLMREVGDEFSSPATPAIYLYYSKKNNYFMLKDTGVGMTLDIIRNHFLNIGKSYYKSSEYLFNNYKYKPIGQYGIGFLACFLLSNNVIVKTKHYKSNDVYQIELEKSSEYVVTRKEETPLFYGTEITLEYDNFFNVFKSNEELKSFVQKYFLTDVPIYIKDNDSGEEKICVENTSKKESESFFASKKNKLKIEEIICSDFSKEFDGKLYLSAIKKRKNTEILDLGNKSIFLYDGQNKKINKVDVLPDGYYQYFQYPLISMEEYKKIAQTRKESERKMKEIIALGINNGQEALLFINSKDRFPTPYMYDEFESEDILKKVFEDSNLNYYKELLHYENHKYSFVSDNKLINVDSSIFTKDYRYRYYLSNKDYGPAYFYNKDILVRDFRGLRCNLPDEYDIFGYINYLGQKIKLDVSRNEIIEGYPNLFKEFTLIILQYKILQEKNLEIKHFLEKMLDFNKSKEI